MTGITNNNLIFSIFKNVAERQNDPKADRVIQGVEHPIPAKILDQYNEIIESILCKPIRERTMVIKNSGLPIDLHTNFCCFYIATFLKYQLIEASQSGNLDHLIQIFCEYDELLLYIATDNNNLNLGNMLFNLNSGKMLFNLNLGNTLFIELLTQLLTLSNDYSHAISHAKFKERYDYLSHHPNAQTMFSFSVLCNLPENTDISSFLTENPQVKRLNIKREMGDDEAIDLAKAIEKNTNLIYLDLSSNQIGDKGAIALANALEKNTTLGTLNLSSNNINNIEQLRLPEQDKRRAQISFINPNYTNPSLYPDNDFLDMALLVRIKLLPPFIEIRYISPEAKKTICKTALVCIAAYALPKLLNYYKGLK